MLFNSPPPSKKKLTFSYVFSSESTTFNELEDGTENLAHTRGRNVITERNIIICIGSLISVALMIAILREFYKYHKIKTPTQVYPSTNIIYEDIAV